MIDPRSDSWNEIVPPENIAPQKPKCVVALLLYAQVEFIDPGVMSVMHFVGRACGSSSDLPAIMAEYFGSYEYAGGLVGFEA